VKVSNREVLAQKAAYSALRRLHHPDVSRQDIEDMIQESAAALWLNWERGEDYAFVCARNAAVNFFHVFVLDWRRKDKPPERTPQGGAQALPDSDECDWHLAHESESRQMPIADELHDELLRIFGNARDVLIVQMVLDGHTNEGIAKEMELKVSSVKRYRSEIRKRLKEEKDD